MGLLCYYVLCSLCRVHTKDWWSKTTSMLLCSNPLMHRLPKHNGERRSLDLIISRWKGIKFPQNGLICVCGFLGKGKGGTPHMHGHKARYKDWNLKFWPPSGTRTTTSWILVWRSTNWAIRRSDESSLWFLRYKSLLVQFIKFNHLYLGTGCVCFFLGKGRGGGHPICTDTRRVIKMCVRVCVRACGRACAVQINKRNIILRYTFKTQHKNSSMLQQILA